MFFKSIDTFNTVKDENLYFHLLDDIVMTVGVENIIQIIIDNASNYILAVKMLERNTIPYSRAHVLHIA